MLEKLWWRDSKHQGTKKVIIFAVLEGRKEEQHMDINVYTTVVEVRNS